jgi:hypothetical protein
MILNSIRELPRATCLGTPRKIEERGRYALLQNLLLCPKLFVVGLADENLSCEVDFGACGGVLRTLVTSARSVP